MEPKKLTVTFIPLLIYLIAIGLYSYYSVILGRASFPVWAFAFATLPVCLGSMAICYVMMIARKINHQKNAPVMAKNDGRM